MSKTLEQLTQQRTQAWQKIEELRKKLPADNSKGFSDATDERAWDEANKDYDSAMAGIEEIEKGTAVRKRLADLDEQREREMKRNAGASGSSTDPNNPNAGSTRASREDYALAFRAWARQQMGSTPSRQQRQACERLGFNPRQRDFRCALGDSHYVRGLQLQRSQVHNSQFGGLKKRALSATTSTSGAEMVGRMKMPMFEAAMLDFSGVLQACDIIRTGTGEPLDWPTANDTGNEGALLAESTAAATNVDPATAEMSLDAYKFTSKIVLVPTELLEDDTSGFVDRLPAMLGERLGRVFETEFTTGSGSSRPNGIVTASAAGVTAAATNAITADEIINLEHAVDPAYRNDRSGFMCHDSIIKAIRLLKDSENRYLWVSGIRDGRPDQLLGWKLFRNQKMASSLAASAKVLLFGDFSKYKVRMVRNIRFRRLVERYADADQEGFVAFARVDGDLLNAGTNPVKRITMAAS